MHRAGSRAISAGAVGGNRAPALGLGLKSSFFAAHSHVSHGAPTACLGSKTKSNIRSPQRWSRLYSSAPAAAAASDHDPTASPSAEPNAPFSAQDLSPPQAFSSRRSQRRAPRTSSYPPVDLPNWFLDNHVTLHSKGWRYQPLCAPEDRTPEKKAVQGDEAENGSELGDGAPADQATNETPEARLGAAADDFQRAAAVILLQQSSHTVSASESEQGIQDQVKLVEGTSDAFLEAAHSRVSEITHGRLKRLKDKIAERDDTLKEIIAIRNELLKDVIAKQDELNGARRQGIATRLTNRNLVQHSQGYLTQPGINLGSVGLRAALTAEFAAAASLASRSSLPTGARRPVPVLATGGLPGAPLARAAVENAAAAEGADVIHLDAHVLGEIIGKYLGQDLYTNKGPYIMLGFSVDGLNGRLMPMLGGHSMIPFTGADGDSEAGPMGGAESVVVGPEAVKTLRRLLHGDVESKPEGNRWDDLKIGHILEQILTGAEAKCRLASSESEKPSKRTIVHLHNFMELHKLKEGSFIVSKLRATVDRLLREQGKHIVLVGSSSRSGARPWHPDFGQMAVQAGSDLDAHTFNISPDIPEEVQIQASIEDLTQTNLTNLALLMEAMLGEEVTFELNPNKHMYSGFGLDLQKTIVDDKFLYRLATRLIANVTPGSPKTCYTQDELNAQLRLWGKQASEMTKKNLDSIEALRGSINARSGRLPSDRSRRSGPSRLSALRGFLGGHNAEEGQGNEESEEYDKYEQQLLSGLVRAEDIKTTWDDVVCPPQTKESLQSMTSLVLTRPEAFSYGVLAKERIQGCLLYGPPGTGKTLMAKAIARQSGANVLEISAASINDKYHGESEKRVRAVFSLARKMSPSVIFLDEADALLGSRSGNMGKGGYRETLNQFLREWDGLTEMKTFVMVATNRPFDLDDAVLRRMPRRILVDLPLKDARLKILQVLLRDEHLDASVNVDDISARTEMCSGSDLKNICVAAAMEAVKDEIKARDASPDPEAYVYPEHRTLTADHFERAMKQIGASISGDMDSLKAIRKFDERFGDAQGRGNQKARNVMGFAVGALPSRSGDARVRRIDST